MTLGPMFAEEDRIDQLIASKVAYHEAGHVVMAHVFGISVYEATMVPKGTSAASVLYDAVEGEDAGIVEGIVEGIVLLAGKAAARLYAERSGILEGKYGEAYLKDVEEGARGDLRKAKRIANPDGRRTKAAKQAERTFLEGCESRAREALGGRWEAVEDVASALLKEYRLDGARLREILSTV